jgi:hypothetical protein
VDESPKSQAYTHDKLPPFTDGVNVTPTGLPTPVVLSEAIDAVKAPQTAGLTEDEQECPAPPIESVTVRVTLFVPELLYVTVAPAVPEVPELLGVPPGIIHE